MANNALLGSRISLISKKNIRYEGILYSINESDATVALQNVKSFGTEGRELLDTTGASTFVAPNDVVHNYLLFRGQDIKDLHVHEKQDGAGAAPDAKKEEVAAPTAEDSKPQAQQAPAPAKAAGEKSAAKESKAGEKKEKAAAPPKSYSDKAKIAPAPAPSKPKQQPERGDSKENKPAPQQQKKGGRRNQPQVGTGASLLNRKARGAKGEEPEVGEDFDFDSNLAEFDKVNISAEEEGEYDEEGGDYEYDKDDFFDSISSDATDRAAGIDNRLRGAQERSLNLDTFGATSLNHGRRRGGRYGGRGRGGRGRGRGRGGRGRGRGGGGGYNRRNDGYGGSRHEQGSGPTPRQNNRWKESTPSY